MTLNTSSAWDRDDGSAVAMGHRRCPEAHSLHAVGMIQRSLPPWVTGDAAARRLWWMAGNPKLVGIALTSTAAISLSPPSLWVMSEDPDGCCGGGSSLAIWTTAEQASKGTARWY